MLTSPLLLAISLGLIIGKPLGVFGFSYLSVKLGIAKLPQGINFKQIFAVAILCGIGFTMSMFLASLAFNADAGESINSLSRLGILLGSTVSAIVGYMALKVTTAKIRVIKTMEKLTCYVIYASEKIAGLSHFLQCASDSHVVPIPAVTKEQVSLLGNSSALFNLKKAEEILNRTPNNKEIAHTLSHIHCWKVIAENEQLQDNDFALIAESEIQPVENFIQHAISYANKYSSYGIIKLQHDGDARSGERLFQSGDEPDALIYGDTNQYNYGCSLYLIRKNVAKKLTALLSETKPYWLSAQFTAFYEPQNIAQARYLLGENPGQKQQDKVENPLFSIIVPIYNVERYLEQCIESVLAQDYQNYELILVDDGSPDNSIDICAKYAKQYSNIVFIHKINGGVSDARNAGIQIARGEYLMFLDSDDYWEGTSILSDYKDN